MRELPPAVGEDMIDTVQVHLFRERPAPTAHVREPEQHPNAAESVRQSQNAQGHGRGAECEPGEPRQQPTLAL